MDGGRGRGGAMARLSAVCVVLFGLFLMHGVPAAAEGCHGAAPAVAPVHHGAAPVPAVGSGSSRADGQGVSGAHGSLCVAVTSRDRIALPSAWLVAAVGVAVLLVPPPTGRPGTAGPASRRGPPYGGRALLLRVCVARS
ncbi:hypothetical protein [Streptantibioticus cattleyicolor]|uniref:Uncharacterized protein n=1 Tax=Streptantibioticus cattleyicolor (strain ATCC 35852 / DSM 46488 / JCM 4925 / NBRC 14057 / NRRL 8057) TaxID=1003195 RepID=F8JMC1_STREN|nr:hypothetical protein [Streptantibioticus cattleyicolor]AEW99249.1 hypothetical protein SCATT_p10560 [Streptantibioticus cattleyicolor NRRL 8057 = DSM 46488]CCB71708.1 conserved exported protein of unknown function [Streptantibioticus cattleyicolor NRRL 8057 = DSM 46488]